MDPRDARRTDYQRRARARIWPLWANAFPNLEVVAYRLDIPRDCRECVTQILDGYGPFALDNDEKELRYPNCEASP